MTLLLASLIVAGIAIAVRLGVRVTLGSRGPVYVERGGRHG